MKCDRHTPVSGSVLGRKCHREAAEGETSCRIHLAAERRGEAAAAKGEQKWRAESDALARVATRLGIWIGGPGFATRRSELEKLADAMDALRAESAELRRELELRDSGRKRVTRYPGGDWSRVESAEGIVTGCEPTPAKAPSASPEGPSSHDRPAGQAEQLPPAASPSLASEIDAALGGMRGRP